MSHKAISYAKSIVRFVGYFHLLIAQPVAAGILLILAEVLGIYEEMGGRG